MSDGASIVYTTDTQSIHTVDTLGNNHRVLIDDGDRYYTPVCSPNGLYVAYIQYDELRIMNLESGEKTYIYEGRNPAWSPDPKYIISIFC